MGDSLPTSSPTVGNLLLLNLVASYTRKEHKTGGNDHVLDGMLNNLVPDCSFYELNAIAKLAFGANDEVYLDSILTPMLKVRTLVGYFKNTNIPICQNTKLPLHILFTSRQLSYLPPYRPS